MLILVDVLRKDPEEGIREPARHGWVAESSMDDEGCQNADDEVVT